MSLRPSALIEMARLEFAAATWFARMSQRERQAYVRAHPRSQYATNTVGKLGGHATALAERYGRQSMAHRERGRLRAGTARGAHHDAMSDLRGRAGLHYRDAAEHFAEGRDTEGHAALKMGHAMVRKGDQRHAAWKARRAKAKSTRAAVPVKRGAKKPSPRSTARNVPVRNARKTAPRTTDKSIPSATPKKPRPLTAKRIAAKYGWKHRGDYLDFSQYEHPKHDGHILSIHEDAGRKWDHMDPNEETIEGGYGGPREMHEHLKAFHANPSAFYNEDDDED